MMWNKVQQKIQWWFRERKRIDLETRSAEQQRRFVQAERELARWCQKAMRGETQ